MADPALPTSSPNEKLDPVILTREGWAQPLPGLTYDTATPSIAELVKVIGEEATNRLCAVFGGMSREIGGPSKPIVGAIGRDAALVLRDYWGRGRIYIPRRATSAKARHEQVRHFAGEGLTRQAIAQRVGMSERQVYNVLAKAARDASAARP